MQIIRFIFIIVFCSFFAPIVSGAAEAALETVLPSPSCASGWDREGKVVLYNKDTLFERINGESELYFPYGFELLASARYGNNKNPQIAVDADVYKMGSLLDAFGMYANYRKKDDAEAAVGAEGTVSSAQLFFYQDRYLVRLQATGTTSLEQNILLSCAQEITRRLPNNASRPRELAALTIPAVVPKSERYIAQSLLGYDFFRRGLIADAQLQGEEMQVFIVLEDTPETARGSLDQYRTYLTASGKDVHEKKMHGETSLQAVDFLYGPVMIEQTGRYLIGAVKFKKTATAIQVLGQLKEKIKLQ